MYSVIRDFVKPVLYFFNPDANSRKQNGISERLKGSWIIKYYNGPKEFNTEELVGHVLDLRETGLVSVKSNRKYYYGQWLVNEFEKHLHIALEGNWKIFLISNKWNVHSINGKTAKLYADEGGLFHEMHLTAIH